MVRMWMVDPKFMCRKHLLGEHVELHMLVGSINKGRLNAIRGHARLGQIETGSVVTRHKVLVKEMLRRGWKHKSPLDSFNGPTLGRVDVEASLKLLHSRCDECKRLYQTRSNS